MNYPNERISIQTAKRWEKLAYDRGYKVGRKFKPRLTEAQFAKFLKLVREGVVQITDGTPWIESYELRGILKDIGIEVKKKKEGK